MGGQNEWSGYGVVGPDGPGMPDENDPETTNPRGIRGLPFPPAPEEPQPPWAGPRPGDTQLIPADELPAAEPPPSSPWPPGRPVGGPRRPPGTPTGPRTLRDGSGQPPQRRRRWRVVAALAVLLAIVAAGVYFANPLNIMGRNTAATSPQASNSATGGVPSRASSNPPGATTSPSAGGIAIPSGSPSSSASASAKASATASPNAGATFAPGSQAGTVCVTTSGWNTDPQVSHRQVQQAAPIVARSPGIHGNCDRLVLILKGDHPFQQGATVGFKASYMLTPLENHPAIRLDIMAPSQLAVHHGYVLSPDDLKRLSTQSATFKELRWVKLAAATKHQATLVISVRNKNPFAAFTAVDAKGNLLVIVDVAALAHGNVPSPAPSSSANQATS